METRGGLQRDLRGRHADGAAGHRDRPALQLDRPATGDRHPCLPLQTSLLRLLELGAQPRADGDAELAGMQSQREADGEAEQPAGKLPARDDGGDLGASAVSSRAVLRMVDVTDSCDFRRHK